ncbi:MAG: recombinase family protein, partial [Anaerolineales bacterium]|nr:recombinase family protein [Anaerolineales bacterium]
MSNNGHTRAVLYARVSSDDTGNDGSNLQSQLGMCREYAEQQGYSVIRELAEDERGASGADHNLPQLSKAMEMARDGAYEVFVVRELDRLARNMRKQFNIEDELKAEDVRIDYVLGRYVDDWRGEFLKNIEAAVAQAERDQIRERTRRGRR